MFFVVLFHKASAFNLDLHPLGSGQSAQTLHLFYERERHKIGLQIRKAVFKIPFTVIIMLTERHGWGVSVIQAAG